MSKLSSANLLPIGKRKREEEETISAFGYECKIYDDETTAVRVEQGKYLIPWKSSHVDLLMDRYDVRHLIDDKKVFDVHEKARLEEEFDLERNYSKEKEKTDRCSTVIAYDYSSMENKKYKRVITEIQEKIMKKYNTPEAMIAPNNYAQLSIIESTSKEIGNTSNSNLREIRIQVKNASNALYSFLNKHDILYPFYKHIGTQANSNLVDYSDSDDDDEIKERIEKTASMIVKSNNGEALERYLLEKNGRQDKFLFLNKGNVYYDYFQEAKEKEKQTNKT